MQKYFVLCFVFVLNIVSSDFVLANDSKSIIDRGNNEATKALFLALKEPDQSKKYFSLVDYIKNYDEWISLTAGNVTERVHITAYLLSSGYQELAIDLISKNDVNGWKTYQFQNGVSNDFMFALDGGYVDFLLALFEHQKEGLNTEFPIDLNGHKILPISMLATTSYVKKPYYQKIVDAMLIAGANPYRKMNSGLTPMMVANTSLNTQFIKMAQAYQMNKGKEEHLFKNTPLTQVETIEMQTIVDSWIEKNEIDQNGKNIHYDYKKLHAFWIKMILQGYNIAANLVFEKLKTFDEFSIDARVDGGLSGLMAATISRIYGGNVEYADFLIKQGADVTKEIPVTTNVDNEKEQININLIQLALQKDNYKVVALLIKSGTPFVSPPNNDKELILTEAMSQKAFKSAFLIKEALVYVIDKK